MDNFYDFLQENVERTVNLTAIEDVKEDKFIVLGSNLLAKLEKLIGRIRNFHPNMECTFIGQEKHIEFAAEKWPEWKRIQWTGSYSLGIVDELKNAGAVDNAEAFIFVSANPINLRDLNIIEIALELKKYGIKTYVYDYGMEDLYEYQDLNLLKKGLEVYVGINDFIELALENQKGE